MKLNIEHNLKSYSVDLTQFHSLALGFGPEADNPNAFYINPAQIVPIRVGDFVGSVSEGGSANCEVVTYCAHGNGTHTECVGHIAKDRVHVSECKFNPTMLAQVISVDLVNKDGDWVVDAECLMNISFESVPALIVRSLPNNSDKKNRVWSGNNPPYFTVEAMKLIVDAGFTQLLTDFPSVDREEDAGALAAHRVWWNVPQGTTDLAQARMDACITEMIFVSDAVVDGLYLLQLILPRIHSDAVPSNPLLYPLILN
jgi:hypothetical protein